MYQSPIGMLNAVAMMNMGGMSIIGNPALMQMQGMGSGMRTGMGADRTAGAASYLMQQAITGAAPGAGSGPSFDAALDEAVRDAGRDVAETLKKPLPAKKSPGLSFARASRGDDHETSGQSRHFSGRVSAGLAKQSCQPAGRSGPGGRESAEPVEHAAR
jgi:hypothetical protein